LVLTTGVDAEEEEVARADSDDEEEATFASAAGAAATALCELASSTFFLLKVFLMTLRTFLPSGLT
jgi:hypothetical protein